MMAEIQLNILAITILLCNHILPNLIGFLQPSTWITSARVVSSILRVNGLP